MSDYLLWPWMMSPKHFRPLPFTQHSSTLCLLSLPQQAHSCSRVFAQAVASSWNSLSPTVTMAGFSSSRLGLNDTFSEELPLTTTLWKVWFPIALYCRHPVFSVECVPISSYYMCRFPCLSLSYSLNCKLQESWTLTILFISSTSSSRLGSKKALIKWTNKWKPINFSASPFCPGDCKFF